MKFCSEKEMLDAVIRNSQLLQFVSDKNCKLYTSFEVKGLFGIPDIVYANIIPFSSFGARPVAKTVAIELKLSNWRRALVQAYKYAAFVKISIVLLDHYYVHRALNNIDKFERSNIGLFSLDNEGKLYRHFTPREQKPYSRQLESRFVNMVLQETFTHDETSIIMR